MKHGFGRILSLIIAVTTLLSSCSIGGKGKLEGDKNVLPRTYELENIRYELRISGMTFSEPQKSFVNLDDSAKDALIITTDDNVFSTLKVTIEGGVITVTGDETKTYSPSEFEISLGAAVKSVALDGAYALNALLSPAEDFSLELNGAANAELTCERLDRLNLTINGAADMTLEGTAVNFDAEINGTANLKAYKLQTENCRAALSGASNAELYATQSLDASIDGTANISYKGDPADVTKSISGLGVIEPAKTE